MKRMLCALLFCLAAVGTGDAGELDGAYAWVDSGLWGLSQDSLKDVITPLAKDAKIMTAADTVACRNGTVNFLFNPAGKLYNISWHVRTPVADIQAAAALHETVKNALDAKYGAGKRLSGGGGPDLAEAKAAAEKSVAMARVRENIEKLKASGVKPSREQLADALEGHSLLDAMPTLFYVEENAWEDGAIKVYASLLCSTDGTCYQHINFVSKQQTAGEEYGATERKLFSYTPVDRDQDLVTAANSALPAGTF